ncbi:MBL fold metallo-hydrolase [Paracoccus sp. p3-h83]|uniref:MBL fold metallo-hydrolase n=1 Tax=Paracoccus sp. p3-h83 TaxID=3342805 RepID=UPI0035B741A2
MMRLTILGCGSSGGVPRAGGPDGAGLWGDCDPAEPRNRRMRCSLMVERIGPSGTTSVLIDTGPDLHRQLLLGRITRLDGVVYTHPHADHIHGIDDLRQVVHLMRSRIRLYADAPTTEVLRARFGYIFETPAGSPYPPICEMHAITRRFAIDGPGGPIQLRPFAVAHGGIPALGFRIAAEGRNAVYLPDVSAIPDDAWPTLNGLDLFIIDALQRRPHPTHAHLGQALDWISRAAPARAVLTNMHIDMDYATLCAELPQGVIPAHDGLVLEL